jgi:hypothetical protein
VACLAAWLAAGAFLRAGAAECSLHSLPLVAEIPDVPQAGVGIRRAALSPFSGTALTEVEAQARIPAGAGWAIAMQWPLAVLDQPDGIRIGMGNPSGSVSYRRALSPALASLSGAQASLPLGDIGDGLADDHFMAGLHQAIAWAQGPWKWEAMGGAGFMLPAMEAGDPSQHAGHASTGRSPSHVTYAAFHPHENRELTYRFASYREFGPSFSTALALDGRHVLGTPMVSAASDIVELEAGLSVSAKGAIWRPYLQIPTTDGADGIWTAGLSVLFGL